jgi:signal transduction histidine kinase
MSFDQATSPAVAGSPLGDRPHQWAGTDLPFGEIDDVVELRRIAAYFRGMASSIGARLLLAETNASRNRQELEQKTRGFSLLSRLASDVSANEEPTFLARILAGHMTSMLNMARTVVLTRDSGGPWFRVLACVGYAEADQRRLRELALSLPDEAALGRLIVSTPGAPTDGDASALSLLDIPYFMAIPVSVEAEVMALIVTGRLREQLPFSPPLNSADLEIVGAIGGFFAAYLARHRLMERSRERSRDRIAEVERLVSERTAEIEQQRALLDESLTKLHETQQQLIMREKLASLGQLTAGIAHEIRNPLNFVNNFSDLSWELIVEIEEILDAPVTALTGERRDELGDLFDTLKSNLNRIADHGKRAASIVRNMLQHARTDAGGAEACDLNALLVEAIEFARHLARAQDRAFDVTIIRDLDASIQKITLVPQQISRVFVNLASNAFIALKKRRLASGADYQPTLEIRSRRLDGRVEVSLRDNGVGIAADARPHIFTPFFTTSAPDEGTGLGLSLCYDVIVNAHKGDINVDSVENEFTQFNIHLPT